MFHRKALLPSVCISLCLCGGIISPAAAVSALSVATNATEFAPCALYIQDTRCTFDVTNRTAKVYGMVKGQLGVVNRCRVVVTLEEKTGSTWKNVATWTDEADGQRASVSETKAVTAGKTYRAKAVVTAWSGSKSETKTILSPEKKA